MKLPDEIEKLIDKALFNYTTGSTNYEEEHFKQGFNAGFSAFRDSEMMRELIEIIESAEEILGEKSEKLKKYRENGWVGDDTKSELGNR